MLVVVGTAEERVVRDLGVEAGAPLREDLVLLAVVPEWIVAQDAAGPVDLRLVEVRDRDVPQAPLLVEDVDRAPVGDRRDSEAGEVLERSLVLERRREDLAGADEEVELAGWVGRSPDPK
jgi:hypothetical protein